MGVARDSVKGGGGELVFNGDRVSRCADEEVPEMNSGDGGSVMWMYLRPLNCMGKNN